VGGVDLGWLPSRFLPPPPFLLCLLPPLPPLLTPPLFPPPPPPITPTTSTNHTHTHHYSPLTNCSADFPPDENTNPYPQQSRSPRHANTQTHRRSPRCPVRVLRTPLLIMRGLCAAGESERRREQTCLVPGRLPAQQLLQCDGKKPSHPFIRLLLSPLSSSLLSLLSSPLLSLSLSSPLL